MRILTISGQIPEDEYGSDLNREYFLTVDQFSSYRRIIGSWFESPLRNDKGRNRTVQYRYRTFTVLYRTVPYVGFANIKVPYGTVPYRKNTVLDHFASSNKNLTNFAGDVFNSVLCCPIIHKDY